MLEFVTCPIMLLDKLELTTFQKFLFSVGVYCTCVILLHEQRLRGCCFPASWNALRFKARFSSVDVSLRFSIIVYISTQAHICACLLVYLFLSRTSTSKLWLNFSSVHAPSELWYLRSSAYIHRVRRDVHTFVTCVEGHNYLLHPSIETPCLRESIEWDVMYANGSSAYSFEF